jgi:membrane-associated phospholipid phosphatase
MWQKIKQKFEFILPSFTYVPIILVVAFNCLAYYATKLLMADAKHYDLSIFMDDLMPLTTWFISFYILAYVQWFWNYIVHCRIDRQFCYRIVMADIIAKTICLICFIVIPTEIARPEIVGDGFWEWLTRIIYATDTPVNLFPSIHVLESYICFRAATEIKGAPRWYVWFQLIFTVFVCLSIVYVKQHYFVDILGGIAVVEIGWFISKKCKAWRLLERIELPFVRRKYSNTNNIQ